LEDLQKPTFYVGINGICQDGNCITHITAFKSSKAPVITARKTCHSLPAKRTSVLFPSKHANGVFIQPYPEHQSIDYFIHRRPRPFVKASAAK
jgi:hypothetical protein